MTRRRLAMPRTIALLVVALALLGVRFAYAPPPPGAELVAADPTRYPPPDRDRLEAELSHLLDETGVHLQRASLIAEDDEYTVSATGTHLALYLEPPVGTGVDAYVEGFTALTRRYGEEVFARWPGLESFDICHMPPGGERVSDDVPFTLIDMSRAAFEEFVAAGAGLEDLLAAIPDDEVTAHLTAPVRDDPRVVSAAASAGVSIPGLDD